MNGTLPNIFSVDDIKIIQLIYFPEEEEILLLWKTIKVVHLQFREHSQ